MSGFSTRFLFKRDLEELVRAAPVAELCVKRINPFDGRSGLEDSVQNFGVRGCWRGANREALMDS